MFCNGAVFGGCFCPPNFDPVARARIHTYGNMNQLRQWNVPSHMLTTRNFHRNYVPTSLTQSLRPILTHSIRVCTRMASSTNPETPAYGSHPHFQCRSMTYSPPEVGKSSPSLKTPSAPHTSPDYFSQWVGPIQYYTPISWNHVLSFNGFYIDFFFFSGYSQQILDGGFLFCQPLIPTITSCSCRTHSGVRWLCAFCNCLSHLYDI